MTTEIGDWRPITINDVPSRDELGAHILEQLRSGQRTSMQMRDAWRQSRKLIFTRTTGKWNDTPTDKFVNEHAWVLVHLQEQGLIKNLGGLPNQELYELA